MPRREKTATAAAGASPQITTTVTMPAAAPNPPSNPEEKEVSFFWERLAEIAPEKWEKTITLYVYRVAPKLRMTGEGGYLDVLTQPITPLYIKNRWGGGRFRLILLENNRMMLRHEEEIEGEPIYDKKREVSPDGNGSSSAAATAAAVSADFQREFISVLREELARSREMMDQGDGTGEQKIIDLMSKASDKAMEIVTKQTPQASSAASQIKETVAALKELGLYGEHRQPKTLVEQIVELLTHPVVGPMITKFLVPKDPLGELSKLGAAMDVLEKIRGTGDGKPGDWKTQAVNTVAEHLPEILDALSAGRQPQQRRPGAPPALPAPGAPPAAAAPQPPSRLQVVPRESADAVPPAAAVPPPATVGAPVNQLTPEQEQAALKITCVNMMRAGASGAAIAAFLEDVAEEVARDLAKYPVDAVTDFFARDPILKLMVEDPRWKEVLEEAREYLSDVPDEETPAPPAPPAPPYKN